MITVGCDSFHILFPSDCEKPSTFYQNCIFNELSQTQGPSKLKEDNGIIIPVFHRNDNYSKRL